MFMQPLRFSKHFRPLCSCMMCCCWENHLCNARSTLLGATELVPVLGMASPTPSSAALFLAEQV